MSLLTNIYSRYERLYHCTTMVYLETHTPVFQMDEVRFVKVQFEWKGEHLRSKCFIINNV